MLERSGSPLRRKSQREGMKNAGAERKSWATEESQGIVYCE